MKVSTKGGASKAQRKKASASAAIAHPFVAGILERIEAQLALILERVQVIDRKETKQLRQEADMSAQIDNLKAKVAKNTDQIQSTIVFIQGLAQQIRDNREDPAALDAMAEELDTRDRELADAVAANTPASAP